MLLTTTLYCLPLDILHISVIIFLKNIVRYTPFYVKKSSKESLSASLALLSHGSMLCCQSSNSERVHWFPESDIATV